MKWLLWRQHRVHAALAIALVAAFAVPALVTGAHLADMLAQCQASSTCGSFDILHGYGPIRTVVNLSLVVPVLVGLFWGATIIGRELESGTVALVWTQSITRRRWLTGKLTTLFLMSAATAGAVAALVTYWSKASNSAMESRFSGLQFDIQGVAPVGYTLFAAALGLVSGVLWRRTLPAMATTVGGFVAARLIIELYARQHYLAPVTKSIHLVKGHDVVPSGSLDISNDLTLHGQVITGPLPAPAGCVSAASRDEMNACMARLGYAFRTVYQPAGRYWTFQWIEFGIFTGLAVLLTGGAVLVLRRRDA